MIESGRPMRRQQIIEMRKERDEEAGDGVVRKNQKARKVVKKAASAAGFTNKRGLSKYNSRDRMF